MRKSVTIFIGVLVIIGGALGYYLLVNQQKKKAPQEEKVLQTVFVEKVKSHNVPINILESGRLTAKNRVEIYSEVQGVMEATSKEFKPGANYKKGEVLVKIRDNDFYANLQAQKSVLQNLITSILPDLRLDYPDAYVRWDNYLRNFDMSKPIGDLPKPGSDKEKFFVTGKNIYTTYYNTKNLEIIASKYTIRAPFNGILTDATVNPGTVIRQGQKLGEFIDPSVYEMEVSVGKSDIPSLSIGEKVSIKNEDNGNSQTWEGTITRINGKVDATTQTVKVYIQLKGSNLKEGMYLEASITGNPVSNAYEVPNSILIDGTKVFVVNDNKLQIVPVNIVHKNLESVVVRGLEDGMHLVAKPIAGAYSGMEVNVKESN
ncbi:MAG: efflux RND transporter periplasmic adaptor subunit [Cyclobacteriaceae bacterium]|nr:efflux RND transporter periplasmic adaptor subunit [Cyclobacteriaceae bacterium]